MPHPIPSHLRLGGRGTQSLRAQGLGVGGKKARPWAVAGETVPWRTPSARVLGAACTLLSL